VQLKTGDIACVVIICKNRTDFQEEIKIIHCYHFIFCASWNFIYRYYFITI